MEDDKPKAKPLRFPLKDLNEVTLQRALDRAEAATLEKARQKSMPSRKPPVAAEPPTSSWHIMRAKKAAKAKTKAAKAEAAKWSPASD